MEEISRPGNLSVSVLTAVRRREVESKKRESHAHGVEKGSRKVTLC